MTINERIISRCKIDPLFAEKFEKMYRACIASIFDPKTYAKETAIRDLNALCIGYGLLNLGEKLNINDEKLFDDSTKLLKNGNSFAALLEEGEIFNFISEKERLLKYMNKPTTTDNVNRMGCSENWYDPFFAIAHAFSKEEIDSFSEKEISHLVRLAEKIAEGLY